MADRVDPSAGLRRAVESLGALGDDLDLVIATGDLVNDGRPDQYDRLSELLAPVRVPVVVVPGNHDDRTELRARYDLPGGSRDEPLDRVIDHGDIRLVCLDTNIPGRHDGRLTLGQLEWLDQALGDDPSRRTIVVQHHPPFPSGIDSMDRYRLADPDAEAEVIGRHPQVAALVAGHYHRTITCRFAGTVAFACPSTAVQLAARLGPGPTHYVAEPSALALHVVGDAATPVTTHVVQLTDAVPWVPSWADAG